MTEELTPVARALGRIPTGLYIVTTRQGATPLGFVGSFLMQMGFAPPTVCVGVGKDRAHLAAMRDSGHFGVSILDADSRGVMSAFFQKCEEGQTPFDNLNVSQAAAGSTVLDEALAWFECKVTGEHETGDHVVVFGEVVDGSCARDGDPAVHLRQNGLGY